MNWRPGVDLDVLVLLLLLHFTITTVQILAARLHVSLRSLLKVTTCSRLP